jgi:tetratricopeptide (TPR) repeat protein
MSTAARKGVSVGEFHFLESRNKLRFMTEPAHLDRKLLLAFSHGELPLQLIAKMSLEHLAELCPHCCGELEFVRKQLSKSPKGASAPAVQAVFKNKLEEMNRQRRQAERDCQELLALPLDRQLDKVRRSRRRFMGSHLVNLLLGHAEQHFNHDPERAHHYAGLAHAVILHSPAEMVSLEAEALIYAYQGNARRVAGNLQEAEQLFFSARHIVHHYQVTEPAILGRIDELEGLLRKDQQRFDEAEELFSRALVLFGMTGESAGDERRLR